MKSSKTAQPAKNNLRDQNRGYWHKMDGVMVEDYLRRHAHKTLQEEKHNFQSMTVCASVYARYAFYFQVLGHEPEAQQSAERVVLASQEALETKSFEPIFADEVRNQSPYREMEEAFGQMQSLVLWHYGVWFITGQRPIELLKQATEHHRRYYDLLKGSRQDILDSLLMNYVEAEMFEKATDLFRCDFRGKTVETQGSHLSRSQERTLAAVAGYASGDEDMEPLAYKAVESWYQKASNWSVINWDMAWPRRLSWAWLRGKHFTGTTELSSILNELRGF